MSLSTTRRIPYPVVSAAKPEGVQLYDPELGIALAMVAMGITLVLGPRSRMSVTVPGVVGFHLISKGAS